jgi:ribosomal-protein-alanine N-acetyltransferase
MLSIVAMQVQDIPGVLVLEKGSLSAWSKKHLEDELRQATGFQFVARDTFSEKLLAVLCGRIRADEGEMLKLAVNRSVRQTGIGTQLLNYGLDYCCQQGVKHCYLELRASNVAARHLYEKCGFVEAGKRKRYYDLPKEDVILMQREL